MKREGRQHGMVRTYPILSAPWNPRPRPRNLNELDSLPTAGRFTKVSTKPTNHSKFTGKCGRSMCRDCHIHPACKSKDKVKGAHKFKSSSDVEPDYNRLITWTVADAKPGLKFSGLSATSILDYLASDDCVDRDYEDDSNDTDVKEVEDSYNHEIGVVHGYDVDDYGVNDDDNDDQMSFCEVGFVWQPMDGDESWCLVEEI